MEITKEYIKSKLPTIKSTFSLWFIGTSSYSVLHSVYGRHQLTRQQLKYSSCEYKNKLYANIIDAILAETQISGKDNVFTKKLNISL